MSTSFISSISMDRFLTSMLSRTFSIMFCSLNESADCRSIMTVLFMLCRKENLSINDHKPRINEKSDRRKPQQKGHIFESFRFCCKFGLWIKLKHHWMLLLAQASALNRTWDRHSKLLDAPLWLHF